MSAVARRVGTGVALMACGLAVVALSGPRASIDPSAVSVTPMDDPIDYVQTREAAVSDLRDGGAAQIVWAKPDVREPTPLALVYLHGFSADPVEIAPVPQRVASALGANLFLARLTGHGRTSTGAMAEATGEDWLADGLEALKVGDRLGQRTIVMGTSTGATLALWLASQGAPDDVDALVLVSPNLHPADPASDALLWPWGEQIARLAIGEERAWEPRNPMQAAHWSHRYPSRALLPMMALVDLVARTDLSHIDDPVLVVRDPEDQVVSGEATVAALAVLDPPASEVLVASDDPDHHVLAGDVMSPRTTDEVVQATLRWLADRGFEPATDTDSSD